MRQRGFTPILLILILAALLGFGYWGYKKDILPKFLTKHLSPSQLSSTSNWKVYATKNNVFAFKYPKELVTLNSFDDTPQKIYKGLIADSLTFYLTEKEIIELQQCQKTEETNIPPSIKNADLPEIFSECKNNWVLNIFAAKYPEKYGSTLKDRKEIDMQNLKNYNMPLTGNYTALEDDDGRVWDILEESYYDNGNPLTPASHVYQTHANFMLKEGFIEVIIITRHSGLKQLLNIELPEAESTDLRVIPQHKEIARQILSTFKFSD